MLQKDILSDECDKDSGYEPDQVHLWPRHTNAAKRAQFRQKKQRSLDVHDVRWLGVAVALPWSSRIKIKITETTSVPVHWCFCPFLFYNLLIIHFSPFYFCLKISANFIETYYLLFSCISCFCNHIDHLAAWVWAATLQLPSILHKVLPFFR